MFTIESFKLLAFFTIPNILTRAFHCLPTAQRINLNYSALVSDNLTVSTLCIKFSFKRVHLRLPSPAINIALVFKTYVGT
jgi:hypothetical protein